MWEASRTPQNAADVAPEKAKRSKEELMERVQTQFQEQMHESSWRRGCSRRHLLRSAVR